MIRGKDFRIRVRILVKAFPQPSEKYEETVCCAGVNEETGQFVRLFPIRFRRLDPEHKFDRYDLVEMLVTKATDGRPESYRVSEDSIRIIQRNTNVNFPHQRRVELWKPFIHPGLETLAARQKIDKTSLGIIRPSDVRFFSKRNDPDGIDEQEVMQEQRLMFEEPLRPLDQPSHRFYYRFTSEGKEHNRMIMDWEIQAAFFKFKSQYATESEALEMLHEQYANRIPKQNLHFVMGTMKKRPYQFILIGLLRSPINPDEAVTQPKLF